MQKIILLLFIISCLTACSQKKQNRLPAPASISSAQLLIKGKTFTTNRIGTISPFASGIEKEKPYKWFDEEKELDDFAKKYQAEREKFVLQFVNDTLVKITDDEKTWDAVFMIDDEQKDEEKAGMKFRFSYPDQDGSFNFPGSTEPMLLTTTYFIAGANDNEIVLETPRQFNRSKVVIWMKAK